MIQYLFLQNEFYSEKFTESYKYINDSENTYWEFKLKKIFAFGSFATIILKSKKGSPLNNRQVQWGYKYPSFK